MRKSEELRRQLAGQLLQAAPGDPLPPIRTLAASFGASVGATQIALARLADDGIVTLDSRPGRGGTLVARDVGRLYGEAERMPLLLALALPSTERINGLATAIRSSLAGAGVETYLTFIRGSRPRISALAQGRCNVAVMSRLAAEALADRPAYAILLPLPPGTFVREHRVFLAPGGLPRGRRLRVGIDRSSFDFERLTEMEFGDRADYVPLNYLKFVREIESGRIDAGILDVDDALMRIPPDMPSRALSDDVLAALGGANLGTAFVGRATDLATRAVVEACLDPATIVRIQDDVVAGRRPPEY
ncbi:MAG TPA: YhfZ family protein [Candidatus Limnocylindrales bacterium]